MTVYSPSPLAARRLNGRTALVALGVVLVLSANTTQAQAPAARPDSPMAALPLDRIAAVVGTQAILMSDIEAALVAQNAPAPADSAERLEMQRATLEQLIDIEVLVQEASKDTTLILNEGEINSLADEQVQRVRANFPTDEGYRAALVEAGFGTPEEYRERQYSELRKRSLQETYLATLKQSGKFVTVNVSEKDVDSELARLAGQLPERPATVGFQQIIVPTTPGEESRKQARALIDSLFVILSGAPERFEELAKQFGQDGTSEVGGDLGWNRRGNMVPEFDRVMFMLNPGVVSPPVESRFGWHLIRVDRVQPAEVKARHILIKPGVAAEDEERSKARADSARTLWDGGVPFDSLRQRFHDERSGEDAIIPEVETSTLPEPYAVAVSGKVQGDVVGPFAIDDRASGSRKWVVLKLNRIREAGRMNETEARRQIRGQLQEAYSLRRLLDSMREQIYVSVRF